MSDAPPTFGPELRRLRNAKGWTLRVAAKHFGVAFSRLAEWERGTDSHNKLTVVPPYHTAALMARYLAAPQLLAAAGYPRAGDDDEEEELLEAYRRLDRADRQRLMSAARALAGGAGSEGGPG